MLKSASVAYSEADLIEPELSTPINSDSFKVNIYRARPVLIIDGDKKTEITSALNSPRLITEAAGITTYPEDDFRFERVDDVLDDGLIGQKLTILRAKVITVDIYGKAEEMRTQKDTVEQFIAEKGFKLGEGDTTVPALAEPITDKSKISIIRNGTKTATVDEEIPFPTEVINDINMNTGQQRVEVAGKKGKKTVTYEIQLANDVEVGRKVLQEIIVEQPKPERVVKGTKPVLAAVTPGNVSANKIALMTSAGIAEADFQYVDYIVMKESTWNAGATNPTSGAYGLCQSLPARKMASAGADWQTNPVTQLRWCNSYAMARYGSWAKAYTFWLANRWW